MSPPVAPPGWSRWLVPPALGAATEQYWLITFAWLWVGVPLAYGLYELVRKATQLFTG